ncbi:MAG: hypothetical protein M5U19_14510 [Microthrixaceae bacterium]|nr:hypothetical protein [Microthrixaceae bacterium]
MCSFAESTEVRVHGGAVEHFVTAEEVGIGVRVVDAGRTGISWVGVTDDASLAACKSRRPGTTHASRWWIRTRGSLNPTACRSR